MAHWWARHRHQHHHHHSEQAEHAEHGQEASCGASACGPSARGERGGGPEWRFAGRHDGPHHGHGGGPEDDFGGGAFGVRRPLRFLAWKLELEENQVAELAKILDDLKTERAQGAVDNRRSTSAFADGVAGDTFDQTKVAEGAELRVKTAERLRDAVVGALSRIHAVLDAEQRQRFAYLIRTGALSI
jgi:Spy/CpxP family protein refolding chaperone